MGLLDEGVQEIFAQEIERNDLRDVLSDDQLKALWARSIQEIDKELEPAVAFLDADPGKLAIEEYYKNARAKEIEGILKSFDVKKDRVDVEGFRDVPFSPPMWEVVKSIRAFAYFTALDMIGNYYASRWGSEKGGTFSIDAAVNRTEVRSGGAGCLILLLGSSVLLSLHALLDWIRP